MKMRVIHIVPLSTQAVTILRELQPLTGHRKYVFPSVRTMERLFLALPDSFLIEGFKQYVANRRKEVKSDIQHVFCRSDFIGWANLGILPYFDLQLWSIENNIKIPNRIFANALYPQAIKVKKQ